VPPMAGITFLRLTPKLFEERNLALFMGFVERLRAGPREDRGGPAAGATGCAGQGEGERGQHQHQHQQPLHLLAGPCASSTGPDWGGRG